MAVPAGIIVMHPGTNATVAALSGWDRVTSLDGRFVKGAAASTEADVTGGATTHTHTSPSHTHSISAHTHATGGNSSAGNATYHYYEEGTSDWVRGDHVHAGNTSDSVSGTSGGTAATWNTASSLPPYVEVIFIESDGTPLGIPDGAWAWWNDDPLPTDWSQPAAAKNAFLRGATAAGDGGGTGGSSSHSHTGVAHTHTSNHTHTVSLSASANSQSALSSGGAGASSISHTHTVTVSGGTIASGTSADTGTATSVEPPWTKLAVVQNDTGGVDLPTGTIVATLLLLSAIPSGYALCDGTNGTPDLRDKFLKGADALSELLNTGGALGHDHTDPAGHTHDQTHTHSGTSSAGDSSGTPADTSFTTTLARQTHIHAYGTATSSSTASGSGAQTVDAIADGQPPFRTVQFLMFLGNYTVTNDTPASAGTVSQPGFTFEWTNTTGEATYTAPQNDYQVEVFSDSGGVTTVYDSGQVASATEEHVNVPASWSGGRPVNATTYYWRVRTHDSLGIEGLSAITAFTTSWTPPDPITGLTVTPSGGV